MRHTDLTREQLERTRRQLIPSFRRLAKLRERMHHMGFPADDELFVLVKRAHDAMDSLLVELGNEKGERKGTKKRNEKGTGTKKGHH
jgi:hypothetical protein